MNISRRMFLASIPALYAALKSIDLDTESVKVLLPEIPDTTFSLPGGLRNFHVDFPDGARLSFSGYIKQANVIDGIDTMHMVNMDIVPSGEVNYTPPSGKKFHDEPPAVCVNGESVGDVLDISGQVQREVIDVTYANDEVQSYATGIQRCSGLSFTARVNEDFDVLKLME